jgi:hypothetical protein
VDVRRHAWRINAGFFKKAVDDVLLEGSASAVGSSANLAGIESKRIER